MSLTPGTRLGPYEITAPIGAGGMGEVYRARDSRLKRDVALKILPETFSTDAERLARFQREAEVLASLNHPHIAQIYGVEESNGMRALVMELVEGPTLADRIAQGPIPVDEALPIAGQIADALEAAHEQRIIHRDLKPANIKLRPDGVVKVLDFGLAKALEAISAAAVNATASPTIKSPAMMTGVGVLLGTAAYMSPEQAKGSRADKRSDLWAFGCVLYEMLSGRRACGGENVSETLANVLKTEPDWTALPVQLGSSIHRLLRRTLERDRRRRLSDAADARLDIEDALLRRADGDAPHASFRSRLHPGWVAVATMVALGAVIAMAWSSLSAPPPAELRLEITTPPAVDPTSLALSPDGSAMVFQASSNGRPQLWIRRLDSSVAEPLPRTEEAHLPFWSPDSRSVGFFAAGKLKTINLDDVTGRVLADAGVARGGTWGSGGVILFVSGTNTTVFRIAAAGGEVAAALTLGADKGVFQLHSPRFLPDGGNFLFAATGRGGGVSDIYTATLGGAEPRRLFEGDSAKVAYASNYLFFTRQGTLLAQRFDPKDLALTGEPIPLVEDVAVVEAATMRSAAQSAPASPTTASPTSAER